jgi:hypothetical protein
MNEHAPLMAVAHSFAACIRAHVVALAAGGKDAGNPDTFLEAAQLARAGVERAKSESEIADAQQRVAMSTRNAQASSAPARPAPAASREAQRGHLSAAPKALRDLASLGPMAVSFAIGFGRLDDASRAIVEHIRTERARTERTAA